MLPSDFLIIISCHIPLSYIRTHVHVGHQMNALLHGPSDGARYGECLSSGDHAHLRAFVNELVGKRLLPHLNEALKSLNEWVRSIPYSGSYV